MRTTFLILLLTLQVLGNVDAVGTCRVRESVKQEVTGHVFYLLSCGPRDDASFSIMSRENAESGVVVCFQEAEYDCGPDGSLLGTGMRVPCDYSDQSNDRASVSPLPTDVKAHGQDYAPSGS